MVAQIPPDAQPDGWKDNDWQGLLYAIKYKKCTPFLGAGACAGVLPLGGQLASAWAREYDYPFEDKHNLIRVAQYVAVETDALTPKYKIKEAFTDKVVPNFSLADEPHRVVANLRLPVYITTNYDDFMVQAIKHVDEMARRRDPTIVPRQPRQAICKWYLARQQPTPAMDLGFEPSEQEPVIFHLHGLLENEQSMVLTEDDYLDFLMSISEVPVIPARIEQAFTDSLLLFLGYSLEDMNFKVLFRKLATYLQRSESPRHVSVQLAPNPNEPVEEQMARARRQRDWLRKRFGLQKVKVYWGTCEQFTAELQQRWAAFAGAAGEELRP